MNIKAFAAISRAFEARRLLKCKSGKNALRLSLVFFLLCLALPCCAPSGARSVSRMLDSVGTVPVAKHYLGEPHVSRQLADGKTRHEWSMDRVVRESAHYETRRVLIGYDRDGFPVFEDIEYFIPERDVRQTCRIVALADAQGNILEHSAEGAHCRLMFRVPVNY